MNIRIASLLSLAALAGCASQPSTPSSARARTDDLGIMVMAHGGGKQWDQDVVAALAPLKEGHDLEVAFGMADAETLQDAVTRLERRGAKRIAVVRLFISGESFLKETEQVLGLQAGAPQRAPQAADHVGHQGHHMEFWRIATDASFALSQEGLVEAPEMGNVLLERARTLSRAPAQEDVLILAHGPGDDAENERWLAQLDARADVVRRALPFRRVQVETLREDWPEKRAEAEQRIREFVSRASRENGRALVVPFRVQGFGPYAKVLEGLEYASDGRGLIPDPEVTRWVARQIDLLEDATYRAPPK
jgi:sirohydrochlorin cobaltochelatase